MERRNATFSFGPGATSYLGVHSWRANTSSCRDDISSLPGRRQYRCTPMRLREPCAMPGYRVGWLGLLRHKPCIHLQCVRELSRRWQAHSLIDNDLETRAPSRIDCAGSRHDVVGAELHVRCTRRDSMIANYTNHAANERTLLAWIRTGLAVAAFGFFLIKLNIFVDPVGSIPH